MADSKALIEFIYDSDLETEYFGFTDEDLPVEFSTSHKNSDSESDME